MMNKWLYWGMAAGLLLCACAKENGSGTAEGTPVMFSASTVETRTAYSGITVGDYERINWTPDDQIKVYCPQASSPSSHEATYTIGGGVDSGKQSEATSVTSSTPLQWGSGTHCFYGVYPASASLSVSETTATMSGSIPASPQTVSPDLSSVGYMFAYQTESNPGRYQKVDLAFKPLFNAITFSLKAGDSSVAKQLSSIVLSSDNYLAGPFTASWSSATATASEGSSDLDLSKSITITTTETLSTTDALTVTFITMPITQTNLKLTMNFNDGSTWQFPLKNDGSASTLNPFEKLVFGEISVPKKIVVSSISLSNASVNVGSTVRLTPTISPSNAANKKVTWYSSDPNKATVNSSGDVTGVSAGTVTITATAQDGSGVSGSCTVTVTAPDPGYYTISFKGGTTYIKSGSTQASTVINEGVDRVTETPFSSNSGWEYFDNACWSVKSSKLCTPETLGTSTSLTINLSNLGQKTVYKIEAYITYDWQTPVEKSYLTVNSTQASESLSQTGYLPGSYNGILTFNVTGSISSIVYYSPFASQVSYFKVYYNN